MRFNSTYKQTIKLKDTIKEIESIKKIIINFYNRKFSLISVDLPTLLEENDERLIDYSLTSRPVTVDLGDEYKISKLVQTHSNLLRDMIMRLKLNTLEGLYTSSNYIWRDLPDQTTSSIVKNQITFQFKLPPAQINDELQKTTLELYDLIYSLADDLANKYELENIYPDKILSFDSQYLEKEMPNFLPNERETKTILGYNGFILKSPGKLLHSGKRHELIPPEIYDLKNHNYILLKDRVNSETLNVASIAILSSGKQLEDQLALYDASDNLAKDFYKNLINETEKIIEVKINIPSLCMAILAKGHISEVQSGVFSEEALNINQKNKIETY